MLGFHALAVAPLASLAGAVGAGIAAATFTATATGTGIGTSVGAASVSFSVTGAGLALSIGNGDAAVIAAATAVGASIATAAGSATATFIANGTPSTVAIGTARATFSVRGVGVRIVRSPTSNRAADIINAFGKTMVLQRANEGTTVRLRGKRIAGTLEYTSGSAAQQAFRVKIGPREIEASAWINKWPQRNDRIEIDNRSMTVLDAIPLKDAGVVKLYELRVAG